MEKQLISVEITGASPLLMNRYSESNGSAKKKVYDDRDEAEVRLYQTPDGEIYQPGEHIEAAMQAAAVNFKYANRKSYKDFVKSGVFVLPDAILHKHPKWEIFRRAVVVQRSRIMRCRPMFRVWKLAFQLEVINPDIDLKTLNEILVYAGKFNGIGDYRPKYGRFFVSKFDIE